MSKKQIPTSLQEKGFKSYSRAIKEITGWTQKQFETQKRVMRYRVSNFNKATGANLSAIEELYYKVRYEDRAKYYASKGKDVLPPSPIQQALQDIKTTQSKTGLTKGQFETAKKYLLDKFEGLGKTYKYARDVLDKLKSGEMTPTDAGKRLSQYAEAMKVMKTLSPATWLDAQDEAHMSE